MQTEAQKSVSDSKGKLSWELKRAVRMFRKNPPLIMVIPVVGFVLVHAKNASEVYADMILPLLFIIGISWFLTSMAHGNYRILMYTLILLTIGTMLQCIFREETILANPDLTFTHPALNLQIQYGMAFAVACVAGIFYRKCSRISSLKWCKGYIVASILISMATLVLATSVGGVKNWIRIGGFSIQTTEFVKILYVLIASSLLGVEEEVSKRRLITFYVITFLNMAFLAVQSEFGTLLLIMLVFLVYLFLFVPDIKIFLKTVAVLAVIATVVMVLCSFLATQRSNGSFLGTNPISRLILHNYDKIANRFIFWLDPNKDPQGLGYQLIQAKQSILLGGWLGTSVITALPVKTSDLVYPALIQRCGIILGVVVFLLFIFQWLEGVRLFLRKKDKYHQAVSAGFVFMLFFQALIIIGGSTGLCPLTGITLPFISSGGSSLMISSAMVGILIAISGNVSWKGNNTDEDAFFKESSILAKYGAGLRDRNARRTDSSVSDYTGAGQGSRSEKGQGKTNILSKRIRKGKHSR